MASFVSRSRIDLTWSDLSAVETSYYLEQSPNGTTGWSQVGNPAANVTSFSAPGPFAPSTSYYYRVRAYRNFYGYSAFSPVTMVTTPAFPNTPTGVSATASTAVEERSPWPGPTGPTRPVTGSNAAPTARRAGRRRGPPRPMPPTSRNPASPRQRVTTTGSSPPARLVTRLPAQRSARDPAGHARECGGDLRHGESDRPDLDRSLGAGNHLFDRAVAQWHHRLVAGGHDDRQRRQLCRSRTVRRHHHLLPRQGLLEQQRQRVTLLRDHVRDDPAFPTRPTA